MMSDYIGEQAVMMVAVLAIKMMMRMRMIKEGRERKERGGEEGRKDN